MASSSHEITSVSRQGKVLERELENTVEKLVALSGGGIIGDSLEQEVTVEPAPLSFKERVEGCIILDITCPYP